MVFGQGLHIFLLNDLSFFLLKLIESIRIPLVIINIVYNEHSSVSSRIFAIFSLFSTSGSILETVDGKENDWPGLDSLKQRAMAFFEYIYKDTDYN